MPGWMKTINQIARCAGQYRAEQLAPLGLGGCQYSYILHVCRQPGISQEALARQICIHKSNVARQLAQLEESGFVYRKPDPADRRRIAVYPTEKAKAAYPKVWQVLGAWSRYVTGGLSSQEKELLFQLLENMKQRAALYLETGQITLPDEAEGGESHA